MKRSIQQRNLTSSQYSLLIVVGILNLVGLAYNQGLIVTKLIPSWEDHCATVNTDDPKKISKLIPSRLRHDPIERPAWPEIQELLCPAGDPSLEYTDKLFAIAREELGVNATEFAQRAQAQAKFLRLHPQRAIHERFYRNAFQNATMFTHDHGSILYIPVWKGANIQIKNWMYETFGNYKGGIMVEAKLDHILPLFNASSPLCIVTAIRDPISHFLSGYNEIEFRRNSSDIPVSKRKQLSRYYCMPYDTVQKRKLRFRQFIYDLLLEDVKNFAVGVFKHAYSMSCILTELARLGDLKLSGYLPSLKGLSTAFPAFVGDQCSSVMPESLKKGWLPQVPDNQHQSTLDKDGFYQTAKEVWAEGGPVTRASCVLHAMDYACWKNLPAGVPSICQEVYDSSEFALGLVAETSSLYE